MSLRPEIFIAAAAPELNACRRSVKHALLAIGAQPVEQTDLRLTYRPLHHLLQQLLRKCDAVIHLVAFQFGSEPEERALHAPRLSFTQYEIEVARDLGIPIYTFTPGKGAPLAAFPAEDEEAQELQSGLRAGYGRPAGAFHSTFLTPEDLERQVRALRNRLVVRKSLAQLPSRPMGEKFIGRARLMQDLRAHLEPGSVHLLQPTHGLAPLGGAGASTLAVELAWRLHDAGEIDFAFWLPAGAGADFESALAALARGDALALVAEEVMSHRTRLELVLAWFADPERARRFLVVVDGVENEASWWMLRAYLPHFKLGRVIFTGRSRHWPGLLSHSVAAFSAEQARAFFNTRPPSLKPLPPAEQQALERLAEVLGRVPLALAMLAGHLRESGQSPRALLQRLIPVRETVLPEVDLADLFAVIEEALDDTARHTLRLLACLAPEPAAIPLALFEGRGDWPIMSAALSALERRALLQRDEASRTMRLHRAVRQMARDRLLLGEFAHEGLASARTALGNALHRSAEQKRPDPRWRELFIPHVRALLGQVNGLPLELQTTELSVSMGDWLEAEGRLAEAEVFYRRAVATEERRLGSADPEIAPVLRKLAAILRALGHAPESVALLRRAAEFAALHPEKPALAADLQNLSACLRASGELAEAESISRRLLQLEESAHGPEHPRVGNALHRLAGVLEAAHRPGEASRLYRRAVEIDQEAFGRFHPRLALRHLHLAFSLLPTSRHAEAEEFLREALAHEEKSVGADQSELAAPLLELAVLLEKLQRPGEAEFYYRRALHLLGQALGETHEDWALAAASLAGFLFAGGQLEEALGLYAQAAEILLREGRRFLGRHPHLPSVLSAYREALLTAGHSEEETAATLSAFAILAPRRQGTRWLLGD